MKKILFAVIGFVMIGCTNPSMEEGLSNLQEKLAALEAEMAQVDIDQMVSDLATMNEQKLWQTWKSIIKIWQMLL